MRKFFVLIGLLMGMSVTAHAQDFGLIFGVHESNATASQAGWSNGNEFGFRLGGVVSVPLADQWHFRSGLMYTQRHFDLSDGSGNKLLNSFDYIDVPAEIQYNFTDTFGVFGGLIVAFNVNDSVSVSSGSLSNVTASGTKSMIPLFQVGVNGTFNNEFGIEGYYEMGAGDIYNGAKNYSVFGANFIYWL